MARSTAAVRLLSGDKEPVRLASTANLALAGLLTVDGVESEAGDRILVKDQTSATENGIYTASEGAWYRAPDFNSSRSMIKGMKVHVQEGDTLSGDVWQLDTNKPDIGDDEIEFSLFLSSGMAEDIADAQEALEAASEAIIALGLSAGKATQAEAEAGTSNVPWMTPLRTAQCISERAPFTIAWDNDISDVIGDGTDETAALQALVDGVPAAGGNIMLRGTVRSSGLDLSDKSHLNFYSAIGSAGTGRAQLYMTKTGTGNAIDAQRTVDVGFRGLVLKAEDPAFSGTLLQYGNAAAVAGDDSALMRIEQGYIALTAANQIGIALNGATNGAFDHITFEGAGIHVLFSSGAVGFSNYHNFRSCLFMPLGTNYPVYGACGAVSFVNCCFEGFGSDGTGRAMVTQSNKKYQALSFINCGFLDSTTINDPWLFLQWGEGLSISGGCVFSKSGVAIGGGGDSDPQNSGVRGFSITGNTFEGTGTHISFAGTIAAKTNCRGGLIAGNACTNGTFLGSTAQVEQVVIGPNSIYGAPLAEGALPQHIGLNSYANDAAAISAGLVAGQMYRVGNQLRVV